MKNRIHWRSHKHTDAETTPERRIVSNLVAACGRSYYINYIASRKHYSVPKSKSWLVICCSVVRWCIHDYDDASNDPSVATASNDSATRKVSGEKFVSRQLDGKRLCWIFRDRLSCALRFPSRDQLCRAQTELSFWVHFFYRNFSLDFFLYFLNKLW